jgi:putative effector of murein hydrolase
MRMIDGYSGYMDSFFKRAGRVFPLVVGVAALVLTGVLLAWDISRESFPAKAHGLLAALPLALIACARVVYQAVLRPTLKELAKAILLALAFLFWSANQFWPELPQATLFNDVAIALFIADVFLVFIDRPSISPR